MTQRHLGLASRLTEISNAEYSGGLENSLSQIYYLRSLEIKFQMHTLLKKDFICFSDFKKQGFGANLDHWGKKLLAPINPTQSATIEGTHAAYVLKQLFNTS